MCVENYSNTKNVRDDRHRPLALVFVGGSGSGSPTKKIGKETDIHCIVQRLPQPALEVDVGIKGYLVSLDRTKNL